MEKTAGFRTVKAPASVELVINKSRFIGQCFPISSEEEALEQLSTLRKRYWDATHNCYAYSVGEQGEIARFSDDGEPGGTAGMPMLEVLRHEGLVDVCCVVTRYFGGILLGTGGLVRAYTEGTKVAVAAAGVQRMSLYSVLLITCGYNQLGTLQQLLPRYDCQIEETDYGADVTLTVTQPAGRLDELNAALAEATAGTVAAEEIETKFMGRREK